MADVIPAVELRQMLEDLVESLPQTREAATNEHAAMLWQFVVAVAQGRGLTERYHAEGLEWVDRPSSSATPGTGNHEDEKKRQYNLGVLWQFLLDAGAADSNPSMLPGNFKGGVVASDLKNMLEGSKSEPQLLMNRSQGKIGLRSYAREAIVVELRRRHLRNEATLTSLRGQFRIDQERWNKWAARRKVQAAVERLKKDPNSVRPRSDDELRELCGLFF